MSFANESVDQIITLLILNELCIPMSNASIIKMKILIKQITILNFTKCNAKHGGPKINLLSRFYLCIVASVNLHHHKSFKFSLQCAT